MLAGAIGEVTSSSKISDTAGGFTGVLTSSDEFGSAITSLGDLDGDGVEDFAVGTPNDDDGGINRGAVYVLFMNPDGSVKSHQKISDTDGGFTAALGDFSVFGNSLANLGDLNGDGITDLAVGAEANITNQKGVVYVLFLNADGTVGSHQKIGLGEGNFTATLETGDRFGASLTAIKDLDGDGVNDLAVGADFDDDGGSNRGAAYVLFLNTNGTVKSHQKISDTEGSFTAVLEDLDVFGSSLTQLGDLNGDGTTDLAVGAERDDDGGQDRGAVYVLFMNTNGTVKSHQKISDLEGNFTGTLGDLASFGSAVTGFNDLNGDGITDLIVGAEREDWNSDRIGVVSVLFLNPNGTVESHRTISSTEGNFTGTLEFEDFFGGALTRLGDLNGDGIDELGVGVPGDDDGGGSRGAVYVLNLASVVPSDFVTSISKISDTAGNFTALLDDNDNLGWAITGIGDLDGDGIRDMAVGLDRDDDGGVSRGAVYVLFLNADGTVKSHQKISDLDGNFTATLQDSDIFGVSVTSVGDLNQDGVTDLAVGAAGDNDGGTSRGAVYVLFMNSNGTVMSHQKISDTVGGFTGVLDDGDRFGWSLTSLGDLDGDGIVDLATGARSDDDGGSNRGAVYVLFMNANGTVKSHQKISDTAGTFTATLADGDLLGWSVAGLGDINGDGITDLGIGAIDDGGNLRGAAYILFLNTNGTVQSFQKISDTGGTSVNSWNDGAQFGSSMANVGDLNGDGVNDLAVGAYTEDDGGTGRGSVYVFYLNADGTIQSHEKISDTRGGFSATLDDEDQLGTSLAILGDVDGDGLAELAIGAIGDDDGGGLDSDRGAIYIVGLKQVTPPGVVTSFAKISDTAGNFTGVLDDNDLFGRSVTSLGDLDGDGINDMAVGLEGDDDGGPDRGAVYVLFMNPDGSVKSHQKISDISGNFTAILDNDDLFGISVTGLGDLNMDGIPDLVVGAAGDSDGGDRRGAAYVLFMNADGTVKSHQKISDTVGGLTALLDDGDRFGWSLANVGDLDGDGVVDIATGARGDDDGGLGRGAVYVLFLNPDGTVKSHQKISDTEGGLTAPLDDGDLFGWSVSGLKDLDGDGVNDLAVGAIDDGGNHQGAVHVLFLNANGTVKASQKIGDAAGNFTGMLDHDHFGTSVTDLGDLDRDGVTDLAVGAVDDDDGAQSQGAVYVLLMNADGTVKSHQKISDTQGNFNGALDKFDEFGSSLANLGDLDGDGLPELAVGAANDADGGSTYSERGAVYILSLTNVPFSQVIDDGDPEFSTQGTWVAGINSGAFDDDLHRSAAGNGSDKARWTFSGLAAGNYQVSATWVSHANRATDSPFTARNGNNNPLAMVLVDQQITPDDFSANDSFWEKLFVVSVTDGMLTVELSDDANGYVIADAVRIERTQAPVTQMLPMVTIIDDGDPGFAIEKGTWGTGNVGAGGDNRNASIFGGTKVARWAFTDLTPGQYRISATWKPAASRATDAPYTIFDGTTVLTTVDVNQQQSPTGSATPNSLQPKAPDPSVLWQDLGGLVNITSDKLFVKLTNIANGYVMADSVRIERVGDIPPASLIEVVDDSDPGFAIESGTWGTGNVGVNNTNRNASIFGGTKVARWTFSNLAPGQYRVSATWTSHASRATDAPFTLFNGGTLVGTVDVNQQLAPNDFSDGGINWEDLMTVNVTSNKLIVKLSNNANGYVMADAIRIERIGGLPPTA